MESDRIGSDPSRSYEMNLKAVGSTEHCATQWAVRMQNGFGFLRIQSKPLNRPKLQVNSVKIPKPKRSLIHSFIRPLIQSIRSNSNRTDSSLGSFRSMDLTISLLSSILWDFLFPSLKPFKQTTRKRTKPIGATKSESLGCGFCLVLVYRSVCSVNANKFVSHTKYPKSRRLETTSCACKLSQHN